MYRYGGDEFVVLSEGLAHEPALAAAERLRRTVEAHSMNERGQVTISIGVATCPDDGVTFGALFATADTRLYQAKSSGRNRVIGRDTSDATEAAGRRRSAMGLA
jgi:diguanylate cyclase (GGDEF)-like protein